METIPTDQPLPITASDVVAALRELQLSPDEVVVVHSSLSRIGWVAGGAQAIVEGLQEAIGTNGTLVMPTHSAHLTEPSRWRAPPVPESWWPVIRAAMPAFRADLTPTRQMGAIPETFRHQRDVLRSNHPHTSFAARGPLAHTITKEHPLGCMFGERSPLARLYELNAWVLLLGVNHGNNTSLHLAESRARFPAKQFHIEGAPVLVNGQRQWVTFEDMMTDDDDFGALGEDFARDTGAERRVQLGNATLRLVQQREIVDYGVRWLEQHRA